MQTNQVQIKGRVHTMNPMMSSNAMTMMLKINKLLKTNGMSDVIGIDNQIGSSLSSVPAR
jgi:hypothetical protein